MLSLPPPPPDLLDRAALFLDFDGTLVELAEAPGAIRIPLALPSLLDRLGRRLNGRLAIVSGRSLADLERHIACAGLAISGSHGLELRFADGRTLPLSAPAGLDAMRAAALRFAQGEPGLLVEEKPAGLAIHYRQVPAAAERVASFAEALANAHGMSTQRGKMVVELKPNGRSKGDAIRAFMTEPAFADARPVFVGDDLTHEHGFEAAVALGGSGILVGDMRRTAADYRLDSVASVAAWLDESA